MHSVGWIANSTTESSTFNIPIIGVGEGIWSVTSRKLRLSRCRCIWRRKMVCWSGEQTVFTTNQKTLFSRRRNSRVARLGLGAQEQDSACVCEARYSCKLGVKPIHGALPNAAQVRMSEKICRFITFYFYVRSLEYPQALSSSV